MYWYSVALKRFLIINAIAYHCKKQTLNPERNKLLIEKITIIRWWIAMMMMNVIEINVVIPPGHLGLEHLSNLHPP
jgi:hypothetical protein